METEYRNDFTQFLDEYRIDAYKNLEYPYNEMMTTYLWNTDVESPFNETEMIKHIAFRVPGATRGHIAVDRDYIIREIVFYDDTCFDAMHKGIECYDKKVIKAANERFLGTKLDIHNGIVGDDYIE